MGNRAWCAPFLNRSSTTTIFLPGSRNDGFVRTFMCTSYAPYFPMKRHRNTFLQALETIDENDENTPLALVILNTRGDSVSSTLLRRLWDNAVLRVCADGGANRLYDSFDKPDERARYVPDIIVGDLDSLRPDVGSYYRRLGAEVRRRADQNHNDFEKCLIEVKVVLGKDDNQGKSEVCPAAVLGLGAFGGRFDHEMAAISLLYSYTAQFKRLVILGAGNVGFLLLPGIQHVVVPDLRFEGPTVGLIPVGGACRNVTTAGLRWNLNGDCLEFGKLVSSSNHVEDEVRITTDAPLLWSAEFKVANWIETITNSRSQ